MKARGFTLIEMVATLSCLVVLGATSLTLLVTLQKSDARFQSNRLHLDELNRLSQDFRASCQRSESYRIQDDGLSLQLISDQRLERFEFAGSTGPLSYQSRRTDSDAPNRRDRYRLDPSVTLAFTPLPGNQSLVQLVVKSSDSYEQPIEIVGKLGMVRPEDSE